MKTKLELKGLEKLRKKIEDMKRRAEAIDGASFEIPATEEGKADARKQLAAHVFKGAPLTLKKKTT